MGDQHGDEGHDKIEPYAAHPDIHEDNRYEQRG
jgi:hypothetical protein